MQLFNVSGEKNVCDLMGVGNAECFQLSEDSSLLVAGLVSGEIVSWPVRSVLSPEDGADGRKSMLNDSFTKWDSEIFPRIDMNGRWQVSDFPITSVAVSDDWIVASAFGGELLAMPRPTGNEGGPSSVESSEQLAETSLTWSPDGRFVVAGKRDGAVCRGELVSQSQLSVGSLSPLAAGTTDQRTNPASEVVGSWKTLSPPNAGHVTAVAISPDQKMIAWVRHQNGVTLLRENIETVLDSHGTATAATAAVPAPAKSPDIDVMEFSPDSRMLAWTGGDELHVADVISRDATVQRFPLAGLGKCAAWSADGNMIIVGGEFDDIVALNLKTGTLQKIADCGNDAGAIRFSHDHQRIISGHADGAVRFWTRTGDLTKTIHLHPSMVRSIALSHSDRIGVSTDSLGNFAVWLAETGERIGMLTTEPPLTGTAGRLLPETLFTLHDSQCRLLFENEERRLILRTWDLKPTDPK